MTSMKSLREIGGISYLLGVEADTKTIKGSENGYLTGILYLLPDLKLCPMSEVAGCHGPCLVTAGLAAVYDTVNAARKRRTEFFRENREQFMELLIKEIMSLVKRAAKRGMIPAVRLNGTSDINWSVVTFEGKTIFEHFPDVQFYDYTKSPSIIRAAAGESNWHVTASYSEASEKYSQLITAAAGKYAANLAVVFRSKVMPERFMGRRVVNGDKTDLRFLDDNNVIVGLSAKGKAKHDDSGFVIDAPDLIARG